MSQPKSSPSDDEFVNHIPKKKYTLHIRKKFLDQHGVDDESLPCPDSSVASSKSPPSFIQSHRTENEYFPDDDLVKRQADSGNMSESKHRSPESSSVDYKRLPQRAAVSSGSSQHIPAEGYERVARPTPDSSLSPRRTHVHQSGIGMKVPINEPMASPKSDGDLDPTSSSFVGLLHQEDGTIRLESTQTTMLASDILTTQCHQTDNMVGGVLHDMEQFLFGHDTPQGHTPSEFDVLPQVSKMSATSGSAMQSAQNFSSDCSAVSSSVSPNAQHIPAQAWKKPSGGKGSHNMPNPPSADTYATRDYSRDKALIRQKSEERVTSATGSQPQKKAEMHMCQVCGDIAAGFHCGAFVCEACKVSD